MLQSKLIQILVAIALTLGIATEGLVFYRQAIGALTDRQNLDKITAEATSAKMDALTKSTLATDTRTQPKASPIDLEALGERIKKAICKDPQLSVTDRAKNGCSP